MTTPGQCRVDLTVLPDPARTLRVLRLLRRRRLAVTSVAVVLGSSAVVLREGGFSEGSVLPLLVVVPLLLVTLWATGEWGLRRMARRPDYLLNQPLTFEFSDEGIRVSAPQSAAVHRWAAITKVVERAEFWLLYLGRHQVVTVPKAAFTPDQDSVFRRLLAAQAGLQPSRD